MFCAISKHLSGFASIKTMKKKFKKEFIFFSFVVCQMLTFMTDNIQFWSILFFSFFSSIICHVLYILSVCLDLIE